MECNSKAIKERDGEMRLGEFRTKTRDCENKLMLRLSVYDVIEHNENGYVELDIDIVTDSVVYLRMMNEDIHKWSDGRYTLMFDGHTFFVFDNEKEKRMTALKVTKKLNEQQATIHSLKEEVRLLKPTNIEQYEQIVQLQKENEQLKKECKIAVDEMVTDYKKLEKENEQLKKECKGIRRGKENDCFTSN